MEHPPASAAGIPGGWENWNQNISGNAERYPEQFARTVRGILSKSHAILRRMNN